MLPIYRQWRYRSHTITVNTERGIGNSRHITSYLLDAYLPSSFSLIHRCSFDGRSMEVTHAMTKNTPAIASVGSTTINGVQFDKQLDQTVAFLFT
jgi:hypothetical protein